MRSFRFYLLLLLLLIPLGCENSTSIEDRPFRITLVYDQQIPTWWRAALQRAAERWEQVISHALPQVMLNIPGREFPLPGVGKTPPFWGSEQGTRIYVRPFYSTSVYPTATAGPLLQRSLRSPTTVLGMININSFVKPEDLGPYYARMVAAHEIGHVLGLCVIITGTQPLWFDEPRGITKGKFTLEGYQKEFNVVVDSLDVGKDNHWQFAGDVMSTGGTFNRISYVSIGALMDLGYPAVWEGEGRF